MERTSSLRNAKNKEEWNSGLNLFESSSILKAMKTHLPQYSWVSLLLPVALIAGLILLLGFNVDSVGEPKTMTTPLEPWLQFLVGYLATGAEISAAVVIGVAVLRAIGLYLYQLLASTDRHFNYLESIRLRLGRVLALGLEFTIASDILRTVVSPSRQEITNLGAIVLLRSLLNYFLETEISAKESGSPTEV
jgi:uncharacterized membrane protein